MKKNICIDKFVPSGKHSLSIPGSKSESNRALILKAIYGESININNISCSDDTKVLQDALCSNNEIVDIGHAGTSMRFLTSFFACQEGKDVVLTGSKRMRERPIKVLVDILTYMGAKISYLEKEGFPPIKIEGSKLTKDNVDIDNNISSQYISSLMLIAPMLEKGLNIKIDKLPVSRPYIEMTQKIMVKAGIPVEWSDNSIFIPPTKEIDDFNIDIEPDWSSASYIYGLVSICPYLNVTLNGFKRNSSQGDIKIAKIYSDFFGIETIFHQGGINISNKNIFIVPDKYILLDLNDTPDLAQTIAVTCIALGAKCKLTGLKTLKVKETDRLLAIKTEGEKLGAKIKITSDSIEIIPPEILNENVEIKTYDDHRMALSFSILSAKTQICIENPSVVSKSYPNYWQHFNKLGFKIN